MNEKEALSWQEFTRVEMRIGTVLSAENFEEAHNPSYKLTIDFGEFGIKKSSAQITDFYQCEHLVGTQVVAVVNFPPKQIATIMSQCLVLGGVDENNAVTLLTAKGKVKNGTRVG